MVPVEVIGPPEEAMSALPTTATEATPLKEPLLTEVTRPFASTATVASE